MSLGPAPVLAALLGLLHVSLYVLIRGSAGQRLPWLLLAAFLGAWAGDALGARLGIGDLLVGDFHLITASILAWVGIVGTAIVAILGAQPGRAPRPLRPESPSTALSLTRAARLLDARDLEATERRGAGTGHADADTDRADADPVNAAPASATDASDPQDQDPLGPR